jgi:hypothetical protein
LHAQRLFQLLYLPTERWLGDVKPLRGTREVPLLGNRHEVPEVS